jgi:RNA polymerase sigma-70 factor (ECF subfamily)
MSVSNVDKTAFASLYDEEVARVYGYFGYRLASRADAEDLTQQTFERALGAWTSFDAERGAARTWLLAIAHNLLVDHYRGRPRALRLVDAAAAEEEIERRLAPAEEIGISAELADALEALGPREREIIALRFGGDLTGPEIAELLELSVANVQQIMSRSLRRMRDRLAPVLRATG